MASTQVVSQPGRWALDGDSFKDELFAAGPWQVAIHAMVTGMLFVIIAQQIDPGAPATV